MIQKEALEVLKLKPYTIADCNDLYTEIFTKYESLSQFEQEILSSTNYDAKTLNKYWWVLNYHSEKMDSSRRLRALLESKIEKIAESQAC
jgi:hypothetical protein